MILEGTVNGSSNISFSDGDEIKLRSGKTGELLVSGQHGNLYENTYRGRMFHGVSTTPLAIPITSTTSPKFFLWNPYGSGVNCILVHYCAGWASGTNAEGNVMLGLLSNLGSAIRTGGPITAFTDGPVVNGVVGSAEVPHAKFGVAATIVAATQFLPLGISLMQLAANNSTPVVVLYDFNGTVIVPPGSAVFSCASAASVATYNERLSWYEYPT
jgi:hypothetical protein